MSQLTVANARAYSFMAYVLSMFPGRDGRSATTLGTATLIGPRLLLTAGHVVYDPLYGGGASQFEIRLGPARSRIVSTEARTTNAWRSHEASGNADQRASSRGDLGVIVLPKPIDLDLGLTPLPFQSAPRARLFEKQLNVAGFWNKRPDPDTLYRAHFRPLAGGMSDAYPWRIFYSVPTVAGMSGGPVWTVSPDGKSRTLWAIHTASFRGFGTALRLADQAFQLVQGWYNEFHPSIA